MRRYLTAGVAAGVSAATLGAVLSLASASSATRPRGTVQSYLVESPHNQVLPAGQTGTTTVFCHPGDHSLGGGGEIGIGTTPPSLDASGLVLMESFPFNSSGNATGWSVSYRNNDSSGFEIWSAYVICTRNN